MSRLRHKSADPARRRSARRGFTLVEVLAAMLMIAIVLPAVMRSISAASGVASDARRRTEAAGLAESKLNEILSSQQWQGGQMAGDFGPDWPDYRWQAVAQTWPQDNTTVGLQEIDLTVSWVARNRPESVAVSTLTYVRTQQ